MTKVHEITLLVVDHDDVGAKGVADAIASQRYPNRCISPHVLHVETREVVWSDDHPLNDTRRMKRAAGELFARRNRFDCDSCDIVGTSVDEDWCCSACGVDAVRIVNGVRVA